MKSLIDKIASYLLIFSTLYLLQYYTLGKVPAIQHTLVLNIFYLKDVVFILTSIIFIYLFVQISPVSKKAKQ